MNGSIPEIAPTQAAQAFDRGEVLLLDVRERDEWDAGHAPGAVLIPLGLLDPGLVPQDRKVVVVCRSGNRSGTATRVLTARGHDAANLVGGMQAWAAAGLPVVRTDGGAGSVC